MVERAAVGGVASDGGGDGLADDSAAIDRPFGYAGLADLRRVADPVGGRFAGQDLGLDLCADAR